MSHLQRKISYHFIGEGYPPATGSGASERGWRSAITGNGPPTVKFDSGVLSLALEATSQVQNACAYQGDLGIPIAKIQRVDFWATLSASLAASVKASFGLASARNDDPDSIADAALFRCSGSNALLVESDDGVNDNSAIVTGLTMGTTVRKYSIDFATGVKTNSGTASLGGQANVIFSAEGADGLLRRVAAATLFDMSNYTGNLQLFAQIQKTATTAVGTLGIHWIDVYLNDQP